VLESDQRWNLFGYDLRRSVDYVRSGWRDFLWGEESRLLPVVDEYVRAREPDGATAWYRAGVKTAAPPAQTGVLAEAVVLPPDLVLHKTLRLPRETEPELENALLLEVGANSPFPAADTCHGWSVSRRGSEQLEIQLVISSVSAVMAHIAAELDCHDVHAYEVWAQVDDRIITLRGFGEAARHGRNVRRMVRMGAIAAYCVFAVLAIAALSAGFKYLELANVRNDLVRAEQAAVDAVELRGALTEAKSRISTVEALLREYPSTYTELQRLSTLLGDETWISRADLSGNELTIEGESANVSAVMQQLLEQQAYAKVEAPTATRKVRSGLERFTLKLSLNQDETAP